MKRLVGLLLVLVCVCVPLAACGDDDDGGSSGGSSAASTSESSAATSEPTGSVDPSKPPVTISVVSVKVPGVDLLTPYAEGARIAAEALNKQGGFGGREVKVTECNSQLSAAGVTTCARKGVEDDPIAMFGCDPNWGTAGLKIYGAENIPSFNCVNGGVDFTDPSSFGMSGGGFGFLRGSANWICTQPDVKNVTMFLFDIPSYHSAGEVGAQPNLEACGKKVSYSWVPPTATDMTPYVAKAAGQEPDMVMISGPVGKQVVTIMQLFGQSGVSADKLIMSAGPLKGTTMEEAGATAEGLLSTWSFDAITGPDVAAYKAAVEAAGADTRDDSISTAYANVMLMYKAAEKVGFDGFDGPKLKDFLNSADANGFPMPLNKTLASPGPEGFAQQRVVNIQIQRWKDGKFSPVTDGTDQGWINGFEGGPPAS